MASRQRAKVTSTNSNLARDRRVLRSDEEAGRISQILTTRQMVHSQAVGRPIRAAAAVASSNIAIQTNSQRATSNHGAAIRTSTAQPSSSRVISTTRSAALPSVSRSGLSSITSAPRRTSAFSSSGVGTSSRASAPIHQTRAAVALITANTNAGPSSRKKSHVGVVVKAVSTSKNLSNLKRDNKQEKQATSKVVPSVTPSALPPKYSCEQCTKLMDQKIQLSCGHIFCVPCSVSFKSSKIGLIRSDINNNQACASGYTGGHCPICIPVSDLESLREELTCSVCLELLDGPFSLSCNHTFCLVCWKTWADSRQFPQPKTCPLCTQQVIELGPDTRMAQVVQIFKRQLEFEEAMPNMLWAMAKRELSQVDVSSLGPAKKSRQVDIK